MNKRMREPFHALIWKASVGYNDSWSQVNPEVLEKFAELIIKECLNILDDENGDIDYCKHLIRNKFGVK